MTTEAEINKRCYELFELLNKPQKTPGLATRCNVLLLELRGLSDELARDGEEMPVEPFECMGPELRMACFDMFLGLMAATLGIVLPEKPQ